MDALYTRADYELLPEEFPAELIEGMLVKEPSPQFGHGRIGSLIRYQLKHVVNPELVPDPPADVVIDDHNVFHPDIIVLRALPSDDVHDVGIPILAMEILSPGTEQRDRQIKTVRMLEAGVGEVWLIDWRAQAIEIHTRMWHRRFVGEEEAASSAVEGFSLVPKTLFAR